MRIFLASLGGALFAAAGAMAQTLDPECTIGTADMGSPEACSPVVGCLERSGTYFTGRAIGWDEGTFAARSSSGAICTGEWVTRNAMGLGEAIFTCDDGTSGIAFFTYQDSYTGTATGQGMTDDLQRIRIWSGHNIKQFLRNQTGEVDPQLMCGDEVIPIS
ncbi:MAG: hypothetical protein AAGJ74_11840 [Pseudomonadota bacterium]